LNDVLRSVIFGAKGATPDMPVVFDLERTRRLLTDLKGANTEAAKKERFGQYLTLTFAGDASAQHVITKIALGAEQIVVNIPRGPSARTGRADSQTTTLIIEWEKDLRKTGNHAIEQLQDYLSGNWKSGEDYQFTLVATDGIRWRTFAPDWSEITGDILSSYDDFALKEIDKFDLDTTTLDDFPFFLDRTLFVTDLKAATLHNISNDFGDTSTSFINSRECLNRCLAQIDKDSALQVAIKQWRSFLSIAYGEFDASPQKFLVHTYLSVFSKMIAYHVLSRVDRTDDETIKSIINGDEFNKFNVERFVENDFFHWVVKEPFFSTLRPMFLSLRRTIADYGLSRVEEDILKGVYQELIDLDTRHALGEYYTPDWLCERMVAELTLTSTDRILDPACGSGSFLRATVDHLKLKDPHSTASQLANAVYGIDIHPLSVQIAKTTLLLALSQKLSEATEPVCLNVFLANSLLVPTGTADLFQSRFTVTVDDEQYDIDLKGIRGASDFDRAIDICSDLIRPGERNLSIDAFREVVHPNLPPNASATLVEELHRIYKGMKKATEQNRDSIWRFILQNSYKPIFLGGYFNAVVGNPPWLTYAAIKNSNYQNVIKNLSDNYSVTPLKKANMPHLEIGAVFFAHSCNYFLKPGGRISFVLPRSLISADQHDQTRSGNVKFVKVTGVWDLKGVSPLFRVPCCVFWGVKSPGPNPIPAAGIKGFAISGRLPQAQIHWESAKSRLTITNSLWFYSSLSGSRSKRKTALTTAPLGVNGKNAYEAQFKQGATLLPRVFYFVNQESGLWPIGGAQNNSILSVKSDITLAKKPWITSLRGRIEGKYIFATALWRNILPFCIFKPPMTVLPVAIRGGEVKQFKLLEAKELMAAAARNASLWFESAERVYLKNRTSRAKKNKLSMLGRLNYQQGVTAQKPDFRSLVLYTSSSKDASAVVVTPEDFDAQFVCDHKAYWFETGNKQEANYVAAFLNSRRANTLMKDFQSTGLFGPRDVHKTILMLPLPKFSSKNAAHVELAKQAASAQRSRERWRKRKTRKFWTRVPLVDFGPRSSVRLRAPCCA
jgi:hypothetical protein